MEPNPDRLKEGLEEIQRLGEPPLIDFDPNAQRIFREVWEILTDEQKEKLAKSLTPNDQITLLEFLPSQGIGLAIREALDSHDSIYVVAHLTKYHDPHNLESVPLETYTRVAERQILRYLAAIDNELGEY